MNGEICSEDSREKARTTAEMAVGESQIKKITQTHSTSQEDQCCICGVHFAAIKAAV